MELYNYKLKEVLKLKDNEDYFIVGRALKGKNILKCKDIDDKPYGLIKELQQFLHSQDYEKILELFIRYTQDVEEVDDISANKVFNMNVFDFFYQWNYILDEIKKVSKREFNYLSYTPTSKEESAGIEELYRFGTFATIDRLAGGDVLKYKEIERIDYGIIFTKLYMEAETRKYEQAYRNLKH